jgi:hypothetical protein
MRHWLSERQQTVSSQMVTSDMSAPRAYASTTVYRLPSTILAGVLAAAKLSRSTMPLCATRLVDQIHASPGRVVLAVAGGGSRAISELLEVPGASQTVLEAAVPYSEAAMITYLGGRPEQFCSARTARAMAMVAFLRACRYTTGDCPSFRAAKTGLSPCAADSPTASCVAGVAATAGLATSRPRRGPHHAHVALQTAGLSASWSLQLAKGRRRRAEEEELVCGLLINAVAEACGVAERIELALFDGEQIERVETVAPQPWQDLLLGKLEAVSQAGATAQAVLPGAFDPLHVGHRRMAQVAAELLHVPVAMEISILNVDKPPLDYFEIEQRLGQFPADQGVWLTRAATFEEKSRLFPGATFVVGTDTLQRIAEPHYYGGDAAARHAALERIAQRGCRFLVFGRDTGSGFVRLGDLELPDVLRDICEEIPAGQFREDISSTELRRFGKR